jgi:hypothetical protein
MMVFVTKTNSCFSLIYITILKNKLPCDHEVMGSKSWKQPLAEMQGKTAYIKSKVVGPCTSGTYVHQVALY